MKKISDWWYVLSLKSQLQIFKRVVMVLSGTSIATDHAYIGLTVMVIGGIIDEVMNTLK